MSIATQLRAMAAEVRGDIHKQLLTQAASIIEKRENDNAARLLQEVLAKPEPTEWLKLPWGGVVRKSEVSVVRVDDTGGEGLSRVEVWAVNKTFESDRRAFAVSNEWLADIEAQLGIVR